MARAWLLRSLSEKQLAVLLRMLPRLLEGPERFYRWAGLELKFRHTVRVLARVSEEYEQASQSIGLQSSLSELRNELARLEKHADEVERLTPSSPAGRKLGGRPKELGARLAGGIRTLSAVFGRSFTASEAVCLAILLDIERPCARRDDFERAVARWKKKMAAAPHPSADFIRDGRTIVISAPSFWGTNRPRARKVSGPRPHEPR
jgi:hypothetical protein